MASLLAAISAGTVRSHALLAGATVASDAIGRALLAHPLTLAAFLGIVYVLLDWARRRLGNDSIEASRLPPFVSGERLRGGTGSAEVICEPFPGPPSRQHRPGGHRTW
jgi:hypothetical protein